jgi:hypothetical protein
MARPHLREVTLETLSGGMVSELFSHELGRVLEDIDDVNTLPKTTREINIKITFTPSENREMATCVVKVASKLAGVKPTTTALHLSRENNRLVALAADPRQYEIDFPEFAGERAEANAD